MREGVKEGESEGKDLEIKSTANKLLKFSGSIRVRQIFLINHMAGFWGYKNYVYYKSGCSQFSAFPSRVESE